MLSQLFNFRTSLITVSRKPSFHKFTMGSFALMGYVRRLAYQPASSGSGPRTGLVAAVSKERIEYFVDDDDVDSSLLSCARLVIIVSRGSRGAQ